MVRVLDLPDRGSLLVATDLQGNARDFSRLVEIYEGKVRANADTYLVITGDLVHGPELSPAEWPSHLGSYYVGASGPLLERAKELQDAYADRVIFLLGNHEHAHLGGPIVGKFFPDEAARLEELLGRQASNEVRQWLETWPLLAVAPHAGLCMLHGAPRAPHNGRKSLERLRFRSIGGVSPISLPGGNVLGSILWSRHADHEQAKLFLRNLDPSLTVAVHGHDVVREGACVESPAHLCLSTSFGCFDGDKLFLEWDLSVQIRDANQLFEQGMRRLWPEETPIYLDERLR